ncbi:hypothetical protein WJX81_004534 [Elliptochloris bilobata]|uniref:Galactose-1-phosphate uridyl transferase N-terminal domain-containing protein n=1 Tax=Elliptochloris bilobata TaxID=381761 RepID=A0AAW1RVL8_9CHLO
MLEFGFLPGGPGRTIIASWEAPPSQRGKLDSQRVVSIGDAYLGTQAWYNEARSSKPQTFAAAPAQDPTASSGSCDFCRWRELTAEDAWGRVENEHALTASNLFKYCQPAHGLVLFRRHDPLAFSAPELAGALAAASEWLRQAARAHPGAHHPLLLWNCLPRAGASQFHGHMQVALSQVPFPAELRLEAATRRYEGEAGAGRGGYLVGVRRAHAAAGLLRRHGPPGHGAWCYAALAPTKDAELVLHARSLACPALAALLFAALRALIDGLVVTAFNTAAINMRLDGAANGADSPVIVRLVSRGRGAASDVGALEVACLHACLDWTR